jgi:hypothetical protein
LFILLVGLLAVAPTLVAKFGRPWITGMVEERINGSVTLGALSAGWFSPLEVEGLTIRGEESDQAQVEVGTASVDAGLFSLAFKSRRTAEVTLKDVTIRGTRKDGVLDLSRLLKSPPETSDGGPDDGADDGAKGGADGGAFPDVDIRVVVEDLDVHYVDDTLADAVTLVGIQGVVHLVTGESLTLSLDHPDLVLKGTAEIFDGKVLREADAMAFDGTVLARSLDLSQWGGLASPWVVGLGGTLDADQRVTWNGTDLEIVGSTSLREGRGRLVGRAPQVVISAGELNLVFAPGGSVELKTFRVVADGLQVQGTGGGRLPADGLGPAFAGRFRAEGDLLRLAPLVGGLPHLEGVLHSDIGVKLEGNGQLSVDGSSRIANLVAKNLPGGAPDIRERSVVLHHDLDVGDGELIVRKAGVEASFLNVEVTGNLRRSGGQNTGRVTLSGRADLAPIRGLLGERLPVDLSGATQVSAQLDGSGDGYQLVAHVQGQSVKASGPSVPQGSLDLGTVDLKTSGRVSQDFSSVVLPELAFSSRLLSGKSPVDLRLPESGPMTGKVRFDLTGQIAPVLAAMQPDLEYQVEGVAAAVGEVELGPVMRIKAQLRGRDVFARGAVFKPEGWRSEGVFTKIEGTFDADKKTLVLGKAEFSSSTATLSTKGVVQVLALGTESMSVACDGVEGQLALAPLAPDVLGLPPDARLVGMLTFNGGGRWKASASQGYIKATINPLRLQRPASELRGSLVLDGRLDLGGRLNVALDGTNLKMSQDGRPLSPTPMRMELVGQEREGGGWTISRLGVTGPGIQTLGGTASFGPKGDMELALDGTLQLKPFSDTWLALFASGVKAAGAGVVKVNLSAPAGETPFMERVKGTASGRMDQVQSSIFDLRQVVANVSIGDRRLQITKGTATLNGGPVDLGGHVEFVDPEPVWKMTVKAADVAVKQEMRPEIARIIPLFAGVGLSLETKAGADITLSGRGFDGTRVRSSLTGGGPLSLSPGFVAGGPILGGLSSLVGIPGRLDFDAVATRFQVKDGRVAQDGLLLTSSVVDIRMSGVTALDGALDWKLGVRVKQGDVGDKWTRWASVLGGDGFLPIGLGGTLDSPSLQPPKPEELLRGGLEGAIKKGIGDLIEPKKETGTEDPDKKKQAPKNPLEGLFPGGLGGILKPKDPPPPPPKDPKQTTDPKQAPTGGDAPRR